MSDIDTDVDLIKALVGTIKDLKAGSIETQKRIFTHLEKQTQLYEEIKAEVKKQNRILESSSNVKFNV